MSSTSQSIGPDVPPDVRVDSKPSSGTKHSCPLLSATKLLLLAGPALPPAKQEAGVTVGAWSCCSLPVSSWLFPAISGHRRPRGLFCMFLLSFKTLWMQQLLLFCYVALKWSWYNRLLHRCKGLDSSPPASCLPWCRRRLRGVGGRGCESQRLCPHLHSPSFFFSTAGPFLLRSLESSCSLFSSL